MTLAEQIVRDIANDVHEAQQRAMATAVLDFFGATGRFPEYVWHECASAPWLPDPGPSSYFAGDMVEKSASAARIERHVDRRMAEFREARDIASPPVKGTTIPVTPVTEEVPQPRHDWGLPE